MEGGTRDPYEAQLLAVFNSCLEEGEAELHTDGLQTLCDKLELEERSKELIDCLRKQKGTSISFKTFRDGLVKLLGQGTHGLISKEEDDSSGHAACVASNKYRQQVPHGQSSELLADKLNGTMNGELDHSEICGLPLLGFSPTAPKECLEQIFEKLDMDCDGLISFDEFIMIFENEKNTHEHLTLDWANGSSSDVMKSRDSQSVVHILGPHQTGYARISTIVAMWEVAGVTDAATLLSDLGFTSSEIRLTDLTTVLCEELKNLRDEPDNDITPIHMGLLKGALTLYQEEVRCMINLVEHLSGERDKLRIDVAEANERANLLAQEIDEHHVRLEKSRQDQLKQLEQRHAEITKDLSIQCTSEREAHTEALKTLDRQLQVVQQEEQQVRTKLATVLHENQTLETEIESLNDTITKLKSSNKELLLQVQHLAAEHEEVETIDDTRESEQIILLVDRIKRLQAENALLRDQNDELNTELEYMKSRNSEAVLPIVQSESSEKLAEQSAASLDFARSTSNGWTKNVGYDIDETKLSELSNAIGSIVRELKSLLNSKNLCTPDFCAFRSNISNIITDLETNLSQVASTSEAQDEIDTAKMKKAFEDNDLEIECEERTSESLRDLVLCQAENVKLLKRMSHSDDMLNNIDKNFNNLDTKNVTKNKITSLRDYPPREEECSSSDFSKMEKEKSNLTLNVTQNLNVADSDDNTKNSLNVIIQEFETKHAVEKKQLTDRCAELERSLDLLRTEYEQCEDYWAAKLEEERQLFEQEQKISDDKFSELLTKMAEYEEQFNPGDKARNDGRLSPIEEKFNLEQQYADLEEEYEEFRAHVNELSLQKDNEIKELQERLSNEKTLVVAMNSVAVQSNIEETATECISKPSFSTSSPPSSTMHSSSEAHSYVAAAMAHPSSKKVIHYGTGNHKVFDPSKLNQIEESTVSNNSLYSIPSPKLRECYCQQIEAYTSMEELCRVHKAELNRLYQKKLEIDNECLNLTKQKQSLVKGVTEFKNIAALNRACAEGSGDDSVCRMNIGMLKALNEKLQNQEKKRRHLKISLTHQQQHAERILQQTWQQHCHEVTALRYALQKTEEKLKIQVKVNQEQADRLAKSDILSTDLYVQNAHLIASVKRLEHHCLALTQFSAEATSV